MSIGLIALGTVLLASVYLLRSHGMTFSVDAARIQEEAETAGALKDVEALQFGLTHGLSLMEGVNRVVVERLKVAFAAALAGFVVETVGLGLGAALV